jgi:hypothetical protein
MAKKILLTVVLFLNFIFAGQAQKFFIFEQLAVGVEAGTYGPGITLATSLSPNFKLRAGLDLLRYKYTGIDLFGFKDSGVWDISPDGYLPSDPETTESLNGTLFNPKLAFTNAKLIVDYYPKKNGVFSLSAGLYAGSNSVSLNGKIENYTNPDVVFDYHGCVVKPNADGTFEGKLRFGNAIKPYFGLGLGRTIANSRVGFKFDLGIIYQGNFGFENNKNFNSNTATNQINDQMKEWSEDFGVPVWVLKCWPMINFSLSYRIF